MTIRPLAARLVLALCLLPACSSPLTPSPPVVGNWMGNVRPAHSDYLEIRFREEGGRLVGEACRRDLVVGKMFFTDLPVTMIKRTVIVGEFSGHFYDDGRVRYLDMRSSRNEHSSVRLVPGGDYCGQD